MKFLTVITLLASSWYLCSAIGTPYTFLAKDNKFWELKECKTFISNDRNSFTDWFPLDVPINDTIRLRFLVLAIADVHVMLSPTEILEEVLTDWGTDKPIYQFQIGSKNNLESLIWSSVKKEKLSFEQTPNLLRDDEPNEIIIDIKKDGNMVVSCNGKIIMEAQEQTPLETKYFSLALWEGSNYYYYNCGVV